MKKVLCCTLILVLLTSLCACGSSAKATEGYTDIYCLDDLSAANSTYEEFAAEEPVEAKSASGKTNTDNDGTSNTDTVINADKIIYFADITVETTSFDQVQTWLDECIKKNGGFIESCSTGGPDYYSVQNGYAGRRWASYTIRVPASNFDTIIDEFDGFGNIPNRSIYSQNISAQYYDTETRLKALETQQNSLLEMMEKAKTVEDLLTIESRLSDIRYEMDSLQSRLTNWDRQVNYSTINLYLDEVTTYTPSASLSFKNQVKTALSGGVSDFVGFLRDSVLWVLARILPIVCLGIVFVIILVAVKSKKKNKKHNGTTQIKEEEEINQ